MHKSKEAVARERHTQLKRMHELQRNYSLFFYKPYDKQLAFHTAGASHRERLLMAANQSGKTYGAGNEVAYHVTGMYPDWWQGYRFEKENRGWVSSVTAELTRDGAQRILLGPVGKWGSGCIPKELILDIKRARGIPDAVETVLVRNLLSGEPSQIGFKAYSDGREAFQAETLDWMWFDEEPPLEIYTEGMTRTNNVGGPVFMTFTPLLGMSSVVMRFTHEHHPDRHITNMTIDDVGHYTEEQKRIIVASYPEHEREARTKGIPMLGSGRIFPVAEEVLSEIPLQYVPTHWKQLIAMDFGWEHPTAAVHLAYDIDTDCVHVTKAYRQNRQLPLLHAAAVKPWGTWVPVAWPRDALQHDKGGSCEQLCHQYRDHGLNMISEPAAYPDKRGYGVEAGIIEMLERMQTGRFKVNANLAQWWEEFRIYHRKDGQIVKQREDLLCATRYGIMMLRYGQQEANAVKERDRYAQGNHANGTGTWMSA